MKTTSKYPEPNLWNCSLIAIEAATGDSEEGMNLVVELRGIPVIQEFRCLFCM